VLVVGGKIRAAFMLKWHMVLNIIDGTSVSLAFFRYTFKMYSNKNFQGNGFESLFLFGQRSWQTRKAERSLNTLTRMARGS
jgi:hypothetical protein